MTETAVNFLVPTSIVIAARASSLFSPLLILFAVEKTHVPHKINRRPARFVRFD